MKILTKLAIAAPLIAIALAVQAYNSTAPIQSSAVACGGGCTNSAVIACGGDATNTMFFTCGGGTNTMLLACGGGCTNSLTF